MNRAEYPEAEDGSDQHIGGNPDGADQERGTDPEESEHAEVEECVHRHQRNRRGVVNPDECTRQRSWRVKGTGGDEIYHEKPQGDDETCRDPRNRSVHEWARAGTLHMSRSL
jgi:hypothetical protein